jgi:tripartite-type tricarboxylate transporter receptor subunit TctC
MRRGATLRTKPILVAFGCLLLASAQALAQSYPSQPIRIIVSSSPGGPNDTVARLASQILTAKFSQPALVENRAGAGGALAAREVAAAKPDGYTLMVGNTSTMAVIPAMQAKPGYDPLKDFAPVARFWESYQLLVVHASSPWQSAQALIEAAKANPGKITYAHTGPGGMPNLSSELFQARTGIKLVPVPYRSGGELATAVLTQATDTSIGDFAAMIPLVRDGKLRALAVTSSARTPPLAPEIPTMMELGVPDYDVTTFFGIVAPAGMPADIVRTLNTALNEGLKGEEAQALIRRIGVVSRPGSPEDFATFIAAKRAQWTAAAKAIGAQAN